uniref:Immunoglobulin heavy variable 13-2 n=1 Tax=Erpetoichthys calabaricus TaxID=27687 RepID=A0A8C4RFE4_ERPCA
ITLSCQVEGFDVNSYWMSWIRQFPGKPLEWLWIGEINGAGNSINLAASFKERFTISKDNSNNMLYLQINSLQTEDIASYYCVKYTHVIGNPYGGCTKTSTGVMG